MYVTKHLTSYVRLHTTRKKTAEVFSPNKFRFQKEWF